MGVFFSDDERYPTAAALVTANQNLIWLDVKFFTETLTCAKERAFVLFHEVLHIFLSHGERLEGHNHLIWNYATDYNINLTARGVSLVDGVRKVNTCFEAYLKLPEMGGLYEEKYLGMSSDEIYDKLLEEFKEQSKEIGDWAEGALGESLDEVLESGEDVSDQIKRNIQSAIASVEHAKQSGGIGDNELGLVKRFQSMANPVVNWTDKIAHTISMTSDENQTYNRLSRRSAQVCFPTYYGNTVKIFFGIDSSGSMGESDYQRAYGELKGILEQYDSWEIDVYTCDTAVHLIGEFGSEEDGIDFNNLYVKGGGGTEMAVMVKECEYMVECGEKDYNACIIVTDGGLCNSDDVLSDVPTIFVVTEDGNKDLDFKNVEVVHIQKERK